MEPFIAQIMMFGGNFAPQGWAFCNGQLLPISGNEALFSLIGTNYGGDGVNTFGLPDLRGRVPINQDQGPGLSPRVIGQKAGTETIALSVLNLPSHNHVATMRAESQAGTTGNPTGNQLGVVITNAKPYVAPNASADVNMGADSILIGTNGGGQPVNNMMPFLATTYIIALFGIYPSRS